MSFLNLRWTKRTKFDQIELCRVLVVIKITSIPCSAYKLNRSSVVQKSVMQKGLEEKSSKAWGGVVGCNALKLLCTTVDCSTKDSTACGRFYNQCNAAHCKR